MGQDTATDSMILPHLIDWYLVEYTTKKKNFKEKLGKMLFFKQKEMNQWLMQWWIFSGPLEDGYRCRIASMFSSKISIVYMAFFQALKFPEEQTSIAFHFAAYPP